MIAVLRHELPHFSTSTGNGNAFHLNMQGGATIVNVAETSRRVYERGEANKWRINFKMFLWAIEDTSNPAERRDFRWVQDGERIDWIGDDLWRHIWSLTSINGNVWLHLVETTGLAIPYVLTGQRRPLSGVSTTAIEELEGIRE